MVNSPAHLDNSLAEVEGESVESGPCETVVPDYGFRMITSPSTGIK